MATIMRVGGGAGGGKPTGKTIETLSEKDVFCIYENGVPVEYYISKHNYEPDWNTNRTLLVRKDCWTSSAWGTGSNVYANNTIDTLLNGNFLNTLSAGVQNLIKKTKFPITVGGGNNTVTTMERAVFLLSVTELGRTAPTANVEGTVLPNASDLRIAKYNGEAVIQHTRTPATNGSTYSCAITAEGNYTYGGMGNAHYVRPVFTVPSDAIVVDFNGDGVYELEAETVSDVYGIARDITASSPEWARTDGSRRFVAKASVGTVAGASDFDNIYPWSEMKRVTLDSGDVMVRIPKFYYGRYRNGNIERIQISGRADVGLTLHPAFNHAGVEQDCIYVGAYKSTAKESMLWSLPNSTPYTNITRGNSRISSKARGAGWGLLDISTLSAIQMLYLVEFANNNSQAMIGRGYCDGNSAAINTGSCDTVPNLTGRPAGTDGKTDIVYRGIEGLWGNIWEFVDGVNWNGSIYVCNDPSKYADDTTSNYSLLSYTGATNWNGVYIKEMGVDTTGHSHIMLPVTAASASESTYICDAIWTTTGWRVCIHGGDWTSLSRAGLFTVDIIRSASLASQYFGSRLIYIPQGGTQ